MHQSIYEYENVKHERHIYVTTITLVLLKGVLLQVCKEKNSYSTFSLVSCYSWVSLVLKICKEIAMCLQLMVLFVEIVHIFFIVWF